MSVKLAAAAALLVAAAAADRASAQATVVVDTHKTLAGQPLAVPAGPLEVYSERIVAPAKTVIGTHLHLWARYVYVESGEVQVTLLDSGRIQKFTAGQMIVEPIGKWHSGLVTRDAVLISVEQVPPGRCNTIKPPVAALPAAPGRPATKPAPNDDCHG
jgi:quercetin dioxygenase-like cupin family protein